MSYILGIWVLGQPKWQLVYRFGDLQATASGQWLLIALYVTRIAPKLGMKRRDVWLPGRSGSTLGSLVIFLHRTSQILVQYKVWYADNLFLSIYNIDNIYILEFYRHCKYIHRILYRFICHSQDGPMIPDSQQAPAPSTPGSPTWRWPFPACCRWVSGHWWKWGMLPPKYHHFLGKMMGKYEDSPLGLG